MRIMIICANGVSTGMFARRMQKEAKIRAIKDFNIEAFSYLDYENYLNKFDIVLLAPQIKIQTTKIRKKCQNKILINIDPFDFGNMNVKNILDQIIICISDKSRREVNEY